MELKVYFNSENEAKDTIVVCANESEHNPQHCVPKTLIEAPVFWAAGGSTRQKSNGRQKSAVFWHASVGVLGTQC